MTEPIDTISLGAGVQSSCMSLMAACGEITPMPKCAIFADTQAEPQSVYVWLDWLEKRLPFPVYRVTAGNLSETSTRIRISEKLGQKYLSHLIPAYTLAPDGTKGTWFRQCTDKHKLTPLRNKIDYLRGESEAIVWIGISSDEVSRIKPSQVKGITHRWPLVDLGFNRRKCLVWMEAHGYPVPPRSACYYCPYHSDNEWRRLREEEPTAFAEAVSYERKMQAAAAQIDRLNGIPYLHSSRVPLGQVNFSTEEERGQLNMFNNECEGMCGV